MLRNALPAGLATGGAFAIPSPRTLAAVRAEVLRSAESAAVATTTAAGTGAALLGGLVMSTKSVVAGVAAALLLAVGWFAWPSHESPAPPDRLSAVAPKEESPKAPRPVEGALPTSPRVHVAAGSVHEAPAPKAPSPSVGSGWILRGSVAAAIDARPEQTALTVRPMSD